VTPGFVLPAKWVIHGVPPISPVTADWTRFYEKILSFINGEMIRGIGLCCFGMGFPQIGCRTVCEILLQVVRQFLENNPNREKTDRIVFVVGEAADVSLYLELLSVYFPLTNDAYPSDEEEEERPSHAACRSFVIDSPRNDSDQGINMCERK
jgi:O-acetyl-ADP-ribose deacetylase (regulator of RNase III)